MADLIDRAALFADIAGLVFIGRPNGEGVRNVTKIIDRIKAAPAVDAVEVKHGHWQEYEDFCLDVYYDCSVCGGTFCMIDGTPTENGYDYCPKCGAKMEGTIRIEVEDNATD